MAQRATPATVTLANTWGSPRSGYPTALETKGSDSGEMFGPCPVPRFGRHAGDPLVDGRPSHREQVDLCLNSRSTPWKQDHEDKTAIGAWPHVRDHWLTLCRWLRDRGGECLVLC